MNPVDGDRPPSSGACPRCGQQNPDGFRFCGACGTPLTADTGRSREERKRVTVLFCDLVGFTGRAERLDPEEVRALLQPYHARVRHELERRGGTVEKFIGDAVVALFGAPIAHEDDPERALRAALAIRETIAGDELHVRIGVTTGEALVSLDARPGSGEGMAAGDVVNTAARLQAAAPVDGILVDESTHRATRRAIEFRDRSPVEAKGKSVPVEAWEVVAARSRFGLDVAERATTPLVGRRLELDLLTTALSRARAERMVQLVTLVGVPGIGKSRLLLELFRRADEDPEAIRWRQGRCLPYGEGVTLWALGEIVKAQAGVLETDPAEAAAEKLRAEVRERVTDASEAAWVERHLRPLVGLEGASELSGDRRDEAFAAWRRFFEGVAEQRPLVVVIEDLQWADDSLLDFVDHLVEWTSDVPLLVVATARPELLTRRPAWAGGKTNAVVQSLAPLSDDETSELVHAILRRQLLPAQVQQSLVANAGGNPLYAEEFARMLTERGDLGETTEGDLPDSVQGIIAARLDSLEPSEKSLLQDAAVVGKVFWLSALEAMGGEERWRLERRLHELERRDLVRRDRQSAVAGERQYAFRHLLIREVAYGQIPRGRRSDRHASVARWIENLSPDRTDDRADMLAHHWAAAMTYAAAAGQVSEELSTRARTALIEAGDRALKLNAPRQAAGYFERAVALGTDPHLVLRYGRSLHLLGDERAEGVLTEARDAVAAAGDREAEAFAESILSDVAWLAGEVATSRARVARAVELVRELPPSELKARVLARAASSAGVAGRPAESLALARDALEIAERLGLDDMVVHALVSLGMAKNDLGDEAGVADMERAIEYGMAAKSPEAARAIHNLGVYSFLGGDIEGYRRLNAEGQAYDERYGGGRMARFSRGSSPALEFFVGEWDSAVREGDAFIAESQRAPHYMEPNVRAIRALIRLARDDEAGALADVDRALELIAGSTDPQAKGAPLAGAARVFLELGDPRAAQTALEALDVRVGGAPEPLAVTILTPPYAGGDVEARWREVVAGATASSAWVAAAAALSDERYGDAAEVFARMPFRQGEADARVRWASALLVEGRRAEADEQLQLALSFWRSVGATHYVRSAERLLPATA